MVSFSQIKIKINKESVQWLKQKGVNIPEKAKTVDHIYIPKSDTEVFTFNDKYDLRLTQQKNYTNKTTKEKEIQYREYNYLNRPNKGKISEIKQRIVAPNKEEKQEIWRFYHPKDKSPIRFSRKNNGIEKDNYLKADGVYKNQNGLKIRPISTAEYVNKRMELDEKHFIDSPWTLEESITTNERCGTDSIQECTVVGIYGDKGVSLNHLNPNNPVNEDFENIESALLEQLKQQGKNAKAFVIGSCEGDYNSNCQFENVIDLFATEKVPFSSFKTGDNILYGQLKYNAKFNNRDELKKYEKGLASDFEWQNGQHMIFDNGEIQIANSIIDDELKLGKTDPLELILDSFSRIRSYLG